MILTSRRATLPFIELGSGSGGFRVVANDPDFAKVMASYRARSRGGIVTP